MANNDPSSRDGELLATPLDACHREAGARMVPFAGWEMPVQYPAGLMAEHRAVRAAAGLFDVSHMGEIRVRGPQAEAYLQHLTPNDVSRLKIGRAHYSGLLTERGTYLDDLLIYRFGAEDFLVVANAANVASDYRWMADHADGFEVEVEDVSADYALLALQGPRAVEILSSLTETDLSAIRYYRFAEGEVAGKGAILSRTGYTGEDGFELYLAPADAPDVWRRLLAEGEEAGLIPAGLGARDTLRLEAGMALYGHEIDAETTPLEADLGWVVKLDKGEFIGRQALVEQQERGIDRKLIGFEVSGRCIPRQGHGVLGADGEPVGEVVSGTFSPTFEKALGTAYVPVEMSEPGGELQLEVRGKQLPARVVELPFYKRSR